MLFMQSQECVKLFYFQHFLCSWRNISSPPIDTLGHHHHYCSHLFMQRNKLLLFSGWTRESRTLNPFNSAWYTRKTALSHSVSNVHGHKNKLTHRHTRAHNAIDDWYQRFQQNYYHPCLWHLTTAFISPSSTFTHENGHGHGNGKAHPALSIVCL